MWNNQLNKYETIIKSVAHENYEIENVLFLEYLIKINFLQFFIRSVYHVDMKEIYFSEYMKIVLRDHILEDRIAYLRIIFRVSWDMVKRKESSFHPVFSVTVHRLLTSYLPCSAKRFWRNIMRDFDKLWQAACSTKIYSVAGESVHFEYILKVYSGV